MLKLEILLSCMNLKDGEIVTRSGIESDTLIVNQCGENGYEEYRQGGFTVRIFSVNDKGLTKSRNFATQKSVGDICLLCDDDEIFYSGYKEGILKAYDEAPEADVIIFKMGNKPEKFGGRKKLLNFLDIMRVSSWQISFKRKSILDAGVKFDENMGAGSGNGAEEEFKFLSDCRKKGLKIYYVPFVIADVAQTDSTWFKGFDEDFFINRGNTTRYIMGATPAFLYAVYYSVMKGSSFKGIGRLRAIKLMCSGICENRLNKLRSGGKKGE